jgi:hypothetical protein
MLCRLDGPLAAEFRELNFSSMFHLLIAAMLSSIHISALCFFCSQNCHRSSPPSLPHRCRTPTYPLPPRHRLPCYLGAELAADRSGPAAPSGARCQGRAA